MLSLKVKLPSNLGQNWAKVTDTVHEDLRSFFERIYNVTLGERKMF
jgi:hypothetical protein